MGILTFLDESLGWFFLANQSLMSFCLATMKKHLKRVPRLADCLDVPNCFLCDKGQSVVILIVPNYTLGNPIVWGSWDLMYPINSVMNEYWERHRNYCHSIKYSFSPTKGVNFEGNFQWLVHEYPKSIFPRMSMEHLL